jgi:hypothetical protein
MSINLGDAEVALRSFGRRYGEIVNGPVGDDAWERRVRHIGPGGTSALGILIHSTSAVSGLAGALATITSVASPVIGEPTTSEPSSEVPVASLVEALKHAGSAAADALKSHSRDEFDRTVQMGTQQCSARDAVDHTVELCVAGLKAAQKAIDSAP